MGLFKRRAETKQEIDTLREELRSLKQRLEAADASKQKLAERLGHLDAEHTKLTSHIGSVESKVGSVENQVANVAGSIGPAIDTAIDSAVGQAASVADVESIRAEIVRLSSLAARNVRGPEGDSDGETRSETDDDPTADLAPFATLDLVDRQALDEVTDRLEEMRQVLAAQQQQIADIALVATDSAERTQLALDSLDVRMAAAADSEATPSAGLDDESRAQLEQLSTKVASLDDRVNQVSLELTNQLTELSSDLDRASAAADADDLVERVNRQLDDLTGGQERLANEQARYAIQFREDLAVLADRLRRPGAS